MTANPDQQQGSVAVADTAPALPQAAETFDAAWTLIRDTHFDAKYNGVDWNAVGEEYRPRAAQATTTAELRRVVGEMIATLNQSHFSIIPAEIVDAMDPDQWDEAATRFESLDNDAPEAESATRRTHRDENLPASDQHGDANEDPAAEQLEPSDPGDRFADTGLDVRLIHNEVVVTSVRDGSPAAESGIEPGWVLVEVGGRETARLIERLNSDSSLDARFRAYQVAQVVREQLRGRVGSRTRDLRFRDRADNHVTISLSREQLPGVAVQFGNLPTMIAHLDDHAVETSDRRVGVIAFNIWMLPVARPFHAAVDKYRDADGIIIDLRGNPGGVGGMSMGIAGHFFNNQQRLGTMRTRESELNFVANPRRTTSDRQPTQPYAGPVAILVDEGTASTSEIFAGGLQSVGRARVFGSTSMGAALPARMSRLPNGDVLLHAFADYVDANGEHLEGKGVVPDEPVELTRDALLDGRDPVIEAAIEWIQSQTATASLTRAAA